MFRYAVATGRADRDPAVDLRGALKPVQVRHRAAILDSARVGQLMKDIDQYSGTVVVRSARQLAARGLTIWTTCVRRRSVRMWLPRTSIRLHSLYLKLCNWC